MSIKASKGLYSTNDENLVQFNENTDIPFCVSGLLSTVSNQETETVENNEKYKPSSVQISSVQHHINNLQNIEMKTEVKSEIDDIVIKEEPIELQVSADPSLVFQADNPSDTAQEKVQSEKRYAEELENGLQFLEGIAGCSFQLESFDDDPLSMLCDDPRDENNISPDIGLENLSSEVLRNIRIRQCSRNENNGRVYDTKQCCLFCGIMHTKIVRHWLNKHGSEKEVQKLKSISGDMAKRKLQLKLRLHGNYNHNVNVLKVGHGELLVVRRSSFETTASDYYPCITCLGFYHKKELQIHQLTCMFKDVDSTVISGPVEDRSQFLPHFNKTESDRFRSILTSLKTDKLLQVILNDKLLLMYGAELTEKSSDHVILNMLRQMAKLLETMHSTGFQGSLLDILRPIHFDRIVSSVKCITGSKTRAATVELQMGQMLKKCAEFLITICIKDGDIMKYEQTNKFIQMIDSEWAHIASTCPLSNLFNHRLNGDNIHLVTSDLMKLFEYLSSEIDKKVKKLNDRTTDTDVSNSWYMLAEVTLCKLLLLNKQRGGVVSKLSVCNYLNETAWDCKFDSNLLKYLTALEQKFIERIDMLCLKGKDGWCIPLLIPTPLKQAMDLLIKERKSNEIASSYFFSDGHKSPIHPGNCLYKYISKVNLQYPELICSSTLISRYIAIVFQVLSLSSKEVQWLAYYLNKNNIRIHESFFELQKSVEDVAKVSKLLLSLDEGNVLTYAGKSLDEIDLKEQGSEELTNEWRHTLYYPKQSVHFLYNKNLYKSSKTGSGGPKHYKTLNERALE